MSRSSPLNTLNYLAEMQDVGRRMSQSAEADLRVVRFQSVTPATPDESPRQHAAPEEDEYEVLERRRQLLAARERALDERVRTLEQSEAELIGRETELERRKAELVVAIGSEQDALLAREKQLNGLAQRLALKERQVADYVDQAQKQLAQISTVPAPETSAATTVRRRRRLGRA